MALTRLGPNQAINLASNVTGTLPTANGGTGATSFTAGITVAEMWRLTSNKTSSGDITANLARETASGYGSINHGMTESSGIFTFPSTGIWLVRFTACFEEGTGGDDQARFGIMYTANNSSYSYYARGFSGMTDPPNEFAQTENIEYMFDITDTSNQKIKFNLSDMNTDNRLLGNSSDNKLTGFTFLRLGDT
tara:strand:- start:724 stop:1299 length:576 start_codon:yes stop_codon:yes gene_type:complete